MVNTASKEIKHVYGEAPAVLLPLHIRLRGEAAQDRSVRGWLEMKGWIPSQGKADEKMVVGVVHDVYDDEQDICSSTLTKRRAYVRHAGLSIFDVTCVRYDFRASASTSQILSSNPGSSVLS